jgi:dihydrofolate synthase/folylpolyglutamate synthase
MYQRQGKSAYKANLKNTIAFADYLHHPEHKFKSIHVGGTNGKGSTSHMLASVFQEAGYKVGLYTSPHLIDFRERIKINGQQIAQEKVVDFIEEHKNFMVKQQLSFFEMTVGLAYSYFATEQVDIAIIEVGLGGRLDSTNIIKPELSIITNISLDHTAFLGNTEAKIAFEKAGIIKPETPVLIGEFHEETFPVFEAKAKAEKAPIHLANQNNEVLNNSKLVSFQQKNLNTVIAALNLLKAKFNLNEEAIQKGIEKTNKNTGLIGRWQILHERPKVICDNGHNTAGVALIAAELEKETYRKLHVVLGMVSDKNIQSILSLLPKSAIYYFCEPNIPRALPHLDLLKEAQKMGLNGKASGKVEQAFEAAWSNTTESDMIFVGGSTFVVADFLKYIQEISFFEKK